MNTLDLSNVFSQENKKYLIQPDSHYFGMSGNSEQPIEFPLVSRIAKGYAVLDASKPLGFTVFHFGAHYVGSLSALEKAEEYAKKASPATMLILDYIEDNIEVIGNIYTYKGYGYKFDIKNSVNMGFVWQKVLLRALREFRILDTGCPQHQKVIREFGMALGLKNSCIMDLQAKISYKAIKMMIDYKDKKSIRISSEVERRVKNYFPKQWKEYSLTLAKRKKEAKKRARSSEYEYNPDHKYPYVHYNRKRKGWAAILCVYKGSTKTIVGSKHFANKQHGGKLEAREAAYKWQQKALKRLKIDKGLSV